MADINRGDGPPSEIFRKFYEKYFATEGNRKMTLFNSMLNPRELRKRLGLNQTEFWGQVGVPQCTGSRYEAGRRVPKPVQELLRLVHIEHADLSRIKKEDFEILDLLKSQHPYLYRFLGKVLRPKSLCPIVIEHNSRLLQANH